MRNPGRGAIHPIYTRRLLVITYHLMILMGGEKTQRTFKCDCWWFRNPYHLGCCSNSYRHFFQLVQVFFHQQYLFGFPFWFCSFVVSQVPATGEKDLREKNILGGCFLVGDGLFFFDVVLSIDIPWATICSSLGKPAGFPFITLIISSFYVCVCFGVLNRCFSH